MIGLERSSLCASAVEIGVADLGFVERVVPLVAIRDLGAERLDPLCGRYGGAGVVADTPSERRVAADWSLTRRPTSDVIERFGGRLQPMC